MPLSALVSIINTDKNNRERDSRNPEAVWMTARYFIPLGNVAHRVSERTRVAVASTEKSPISRMNPR